ncbi:hypothetical protein Sjap_001921 [Stephania japonica]|uniref:Uncharacterized protein n=1 Tax=Stephania japonica TaxID=461633 RepID=A0AAP0KL21_9MAGN
MNLEVGQEVEPLGEEVEPLGEQDNGTNQQEELEEDEGNDFFKSNNDVEDDDDYQEVVGEQLQGRKKGRPMVIASPRSSALVIVEVHDQDSDNTPSDELHTDDDSDGFVKRGYLDFDEFQDMADPHLELGMKFSSFKQFKSACRNWDIQNRRQLRFTKNDRKRNKGSDEGFQVDGSSACSEALIGQPNPITNNTTNASASQPLPATFACVEKPLAQCFPTPSCNAKYDGFFSTSSKDFAKVKSEDSNC